jgi:hypothetical protein
MIPLVIAGIAGMFFAGRNAPRTMLQKMTLLGPRTGLVYDAEVVPRLEIAIIYAKDGTMAMFQKGEKGFSFLRAVGNPEVVSLMKQDLEQ